MLVPLATTASVAVALVAALLLLSCVSRPIVHCCCIWSVSSCAPGPLGGFQPSASSGFNSSGKEGELHTVNCINMGNHLVAVFDTTPKHIQTWKKVESAQMPRGVQDSESAVVRTKLLLSAIYCTTAIFLNGHCLQSSKVVLLVPAREDSPIDSNSICLQSYRFIFHYNTVASKRRTFFFFCTFCPLSRKEANPKEAVYRGNGQVGHIYLAI